MATIFANVFNVVTPRPGPSALLSILFFIRKMKRVQEPVINRSEDNGHQCQEDDAAQIKIVNHNKLRL